MLVIGLLLSVGLMGAAANVIARLLERFRWISYIGLLIVLYVAAMMIYEGGGQVVDAIKRPKGFRSGSPWHRRTS